MINKKLWKLSCIALSAVIAFSISSPAFAASEQKDDKQYKYSVYSPEFQDAYIITEEGTNTTNGTKNNNKTVTATVFVEERYGLEDGEVVTIDSKLLSKDEVDKIGVENFKSLETQQIETNALITNKSIIKKTKTSIIKTMGTATNSRGTLKITFTGTHSTSGTSVTSNLTATAKWSGFSFLYSSENNPAVGEDFIGITWSGGFTCPSSSASATWNGGGSQSIYLSDSVPNAGRVWEFDEYANAAGKYMIYVGNVNLSATLYKAKMEGGGNTAEAVLKYIHTYQSTTGSIEISASSSDVGAGFSLSNTDKQWNIVCTITGIPY